MGPKTADRYHSPPSETTTKSISRRILMKTPPPGPLKPQFVIDNKLVTTRRTIANEFNKYFVSLASKLNDAVIIENLPPRTFDDFMPTSNLGSMFMSECTQYEVSKIISELKNGKSSDTNKCNQKNFRYY